MWSDMNISLGRLFEGMSTMGMRDLPEFLMVALPIWMPILMVAGGIWFYLLRKPRKWALWATFAVAIMAVVLVLGVDGALHRIERGFYSRSNWVAIFWQLARPVQVVSIVWLFALPAQWLLLKRSSGGTPTSAAETSNS